MTTSICVPLALIPIGTPFTYTTLPNEAPVVKGRHTAEIAMVYLRCHDEYSHPALNLPVQTLTRHSFRVTDFPRRQWLNIHHHQDHTWTCTCNASLSPCIHIQAVAAYLIYQSWWGIQSDWHLTPFEAALEFVEVASLLVAPLAQPSFPKPAA